MTQQFTPDDNPLWCVVANIKRQHPFGPGGEDTKWGTRQFRGGTKVYIAGCWPGDCSTVVCIGLQRYKRKFIKCNVKVRWVENFRVRLAYHPAVLALIENDPNCWIRTEEEAHKWAAAFPRWQELWEKPTS